jgi:hypothetical protein
LRGRVTEKHRFLLHLHLTQVDSIQRAQMPSMGGLSSGSNPFENKLID